MGVGVDGAASWQHQGWLAPAINACAVAELHSLCRRANSRQWRAGTSS